MWYLPHSQVHNDQTVPIIWPDAFHMHETAIFPLALLNLMSPPCSSTQFTLRRGNFANLVINKGYVAHFSLRMCERAVFPLPV